MRAVHGPERVLHEEIVVVGKLFGEGGIVLRLPGIEPRVLEHPEPLVGEQLPEPELHRSYGEGWIRPLWPPEVRADRHLPGVPRQDELQRRQ